MFGQAVVLCAALSVAFGQVSVAELEKKPEKYEDVDGCYIGKLDTVIPLGESRLSNDSCLAYKCSQDYVQYIGCGVVQPQSGCEIVEDLEKPHPDCCPRIECPGNQSQNEENTEVTSQVDTANEENEAKNLQDGVEKTSE